MYLKKKRKQKKENTCKAAQHAKDVKHSSTNYCFSPRITITMTDNQYKSDETIRMKFLPR